MDRIKNLTSDLWHGLKEDSLPRAEDAVPPEELALMMRRASSPTFSFFLMMALATSIATLGLLADSAPAIIGAMIVAPLMAPIMSLAYGLVDFDVRLTVRSAFTVAAGTALVIGFAYVQTLIVGLRIAESEILDRTSPSLIDLGVAVAAGAAAAFAYSRRSIMNSIAGVAIAVAVVPPLAVAGIGLAMGPTATAGVGLTLGHFSGGAEIAGGAFTLFLTNLVGIIGVAIVVFITQRYGRWKQAMVGLVVIIFLAGTLVQPLSRALDKLVVKSMTLRLIAELREAQTFKSRATILDVDVLFQDDRLHVFLTSIAPTAHASLGAQESIEDFQRFLSAAVGEEVVVEFTVVPVDVVTLRAGPEPEAAALPETPVKPEKAGSEAHIARPGESG